VLSVALESASLSSLLTKSSDLGSEPGSLRFRPPVRGGAKQPIVVSVSELLVENCCPIV
jgi:hypothetical protein